MKGAAMAHVYCLIDPRSGQARYIGQSVRPQQRLREHCSPGRRRSPCATWVRDVRAAGQVPVMLVLESVTAEQVLVVESFWISSLLAVGATLMNGTTDGRGPPSHVGLIRSRETRAKMSRAQEGHPVSDAARTKMRLAKLGRKGAPMTTEAKERIAAAKRGVARSPETVERVRQAMLGRTHSEATRVRMSMAHRGRGLGKRLSASTREKISASLRGNRNARKLAAIGNDPKSRNG